MILRKVLLLMMMILVRMIEMLVQRSLVTPWPPRGAGRLQTATGLPLYLTTPPIFLPCQVDNVDSRKRPPMGASGDGRLGLAFLFGRNTMQCYYFFRRAHFCKKTGERRALF